MNRKLIRTTLAEVKEREQQHARHVPPPQPQQHQSNNSGGGASAAAPALDIDREPWANPPSVGCDEYHAGAITALDAEWHRGHAGDASGPGWTPARVDRLETHNLQQEKDETS